MCCRICVAECVLQNMCCRICVAQHTCFLPMVLYIMVHSRLPIYVYLYICSRMRVAESVAEYTLHSVMHLLGANGALYFGLIWVEFIYIYISTEECVLQIVLQNVCCWVCFRMCFADRVAPAFCQRCSTFWCNLICLYMYICIFVVEYVLQRVCCWACCTCFLPTVLDILVYSGLPSTEVTLYMLNDPSCQCGRMCVAVCCSVLQCSAVCCNEGKWVGGTRERDRRNIALVRRALLTAWVCVYCSVLQCVAVCCTVLQCGVVWCGAVRCSVLQSEEVGMWSERERQTWHTSHCTC